MRPTPLAKLLSSSEPSSPGRSDVKELKEYQVILEKAHLGKKKPSGGPKRPQLIGILGEQALIGNSPNDAKWYAVDAKLPGGYKLLEIHLNSVVLEKDGKKQTVAMFPELGAKPAPAAPQPPEKEELPRPPGPRAEEALAEQPPSTGAGDESPSVDEETPEEEEEIRARMEEVEKRAREGRRERIERRFRRRR